MATSPADAEGPSVEDLAGVMEGADNVFRLASQLSASVEKAKAGGLARERARLARKYGASSAAAARAEAALSAHELALEAAMADAQRASISVAPQEQGTIRVHGRAVDRKHAGIAKIEARLLEEGGKAVAKTTTDENGYFRLDVKPRAKAGRPKADSRRVVVPATEAAARAGSIGEPAQTATLTWELVLLRGQQELARETVRDVSPGQALYLELVVEKQ